MKARLAITEKDLQKAVVDRAQELGWKVLTFRKVRVQRQNGTWYWTTPFGADGKGFPDCVMVRGDRMICAELKVGANKPEPEQEAWREALRGIPGVTHAVWWADAWWDGTIEDVLT